MSGVNFIKQSAALRGQRKFQEAIDLIESNFSAFDSTTIFNANNEIFQAADEMGDFNKAQATARKIAITHPDLPSIQKYLP